MISHLHVWNYWTKKTTKKCWNWLDYYWELLKFVWKLVKGKELRLELTMKTQFASIPDSLTVLLSYSFPPAATSALLNSPDVHFWWEMSICQNVSLLEVSHFGIIQQSDLDLSRFISGFMLPVTSWLEQNWPIYQDNSRGIQNFCKETASNIWNLDTNIVTNTDENFLTQFRTCLIDLATIFQCCPS